MLNIGWFSTGRDKAAIKLLQETQKYILLGEIKGKIIFVFSNREPFESKYTDVFFKEVKKVKIPLLFSSSKIFMAAGKESYSTYEAKISLQQRIEYDRHIMNILDAYNPNICVLAGYMLIVGDEMCRKYQMINLHPALPNGPTGSWQEVIWNIMETGAEESGVMIHLVTPQLDRGPVITYCKYSLRGKLFDKYWQKTRKISVEEIKEKQGESNTLFRLIRKHGLAREFPLIIMTLKALSENKIMIKSGKILDSCGNQITGYDLTEEVDKVA